MPAALALPDKPFDPFAPSAADPFDDRRLCHLLRRATVGFTLETLNRFSGKSPATVLDWLFEFDPADDPLAAMLDNLEGFVTPFRQIDTAQNWWIFRLLNTTHPLQERIALFWHNHFATSAGKVENPAAMHNQIELFRRMGLGSFREMLVAVGRDPAMLVWLDGRENRKGKPNENYGREVMELFTLGIGHYSEKDVQELARAFTGWQAGPLNSRFNKDLFDEGEKTVFGKTARLDSDGAVDLLLGHDAASPFVARKLLRDFVHPAPDPVAVTHYAARLRFHKWAIKPVLREMLSSRMFFSDYAWRSRIKSPAELTVGGALATGGKVSVEFVRKTMTSMGQALMMPPNVKGWDGNETWINANTVLLRFNYGLALAQQRPETHARKLELVKFLEDHNLKSAEAILAHYSRMLLDGQLPAEDRGKLLEYMARDKTNKPGKFAFTTEAVGSKVRGLEHLLMSTPEYQLA